MSMVFFSGMPSEAAEEQVHHHRRHGRVAQRTARLQPGEHPVDHAEEQHGQRRGERCAGQLGPQCHYRAGEGGDDAALAVQYPLTRGLVEELHVLGQHAVFVLRIGVGQHEALDQRLQTFTRAQRLRFHLGHHGLQAIDVGLRDQEQQLVLVLHVVVERGLGDAAGGRHLVHRGSGVALSCEERRGLREDEFALVVVGGGAGAGHGRRESNVRRTRR